MFDVAIGEVQRLLKDTCAADTDGGLVVGAKSAGDDRVGQQVEIGAADHLGGGAAIEPRGAGVAIKVDAVRILQPDHVGDGLQQGLQAAAFGFDRQPFGVAGGDVGENAGRHPRPPVGIAFDDVAAILEPDPQPVAAAHPVFNMTDRSRAVFDSRHGVA